MLAETITISIPGLKKIKRLCLFAFETDHNRPLMSYLAATLSLRHSACPEAWAIGRTELPSMLARYHPLAAQIIPCLAAFDADHDRPLTSRLAAPAMLALVQVQRRGWS